MPRLRKPTEQKKLEGTDRGDRGNPAEPRFESAAPPLPAWLSPEAAEEWERIVPLLLVVRVLSPVDLGVLAAYCQAVGDLQLVNETLAKTERFYKSGTLWKEHPAAKASRELSQQVRMLANELGLSPASRSKVSSIPEKEKADAMAPQQPRRSAPPPQRHSKASASRGTVN